LCQLCPFEAAYPFRMRRSSSVVALLVLWNTRKQVIEPV
jgi:hypothetical protein